MSVLNDVIEPHQLGQALGEQKKIRRTCPAEGRPAAQLLDEPARLLPTVIDRLTSQGTVPTSRPSVA